MAPQRRIGSENAELHRYVRGDVSDERKVDKDADKNRYVCVRNALNIHKEAEAYDAVQEKHRLRSKTPGSS